MSPAKVSSAPRNLGLGEGLPSFRCLLAGLEFEALKESLAGRLSVLYRIARAVKDVSSDPGPVRPLFRSEHSSDTPFG